MKTILLLVSALTILTSFQFTFAQDQPVLPKAALINAKITSTGDLEITPSETSSKDDFDYLLGKWRLYNHKLKTRLDNCKEWFQFESTVEMRKVLSGIGNIDLLTCTDPLIAKEGKPYEGMAVRLFNPKTRLWSIFWTDNNIGVMDAPMVGSFEGNIGTFYCKDTFKSKPILVIFHWDKTDKDNPVWSQAYSPDNGKTWEWNATNVSRRIK